MASHTFGITPDGPGAVDASLLFSGVRRIILSLELMLAAFACWTLAYQLWLAIRLPAISVICPWVVLFVPAAIWLYRTRPLSAENSCSRSVLAIVVLAAALAGAYTLFVLRPDADDFTFMHRPINQVWTQPFAIGGDTLNVPGLPEESILHSMNSYEPLVTLAARTVRARPLHVYHTVAPFVAAIIAVFIYFLCYRNIGLSEWLAAGSTIAALGFFLIDGNVHNSFGNMSFDRLWQGKCIVFTLLIPAATMLCYRFLGNGGRRDFALLAMLGIAGVGLSEVGVFTLPILVLAIAIGFWLWGANRRQRFPKTFFLAASMFYPVLIGAALVLGILHKPIDSTVWNAYPDIWYKNLGYVVGDTSNSTPSIVWGMTRDFTILFLVPIIALRGRARRYLLLVSAVLVVMVINAPAARIWMTLLYRNSYWRLAFLFPLPFCAGLLVPASVSIMKQGKVARYASAFGIALVLGLIWVVFKHTITLPIGGNHRSPWGYEMPLEEELFSRQIAPLLQGRNILGPEGLVWPLALIDTSLRFESTRSVMVPVVMTDVGLADEGQRRLRAQAYTDCGGSYGDFQKSLQKGVDAVIMRKCPGISSSDIARRFGPAAGTWSIRGESPSYLLFLKDAAETNAN